MKTTLAVVILTLTLSVASAQFNDGNRALSYCTREGGADFNMAYCLGMVSGLYDGSMVWNSAHICPPSNVTLGQVRDIFVQHLYRVPSERHFAAGALMNNALVAAFPCRR